jgi:hypothetical protein
VGSKNIVIDVQLLLGERLKVLIELIRDSSSLHWNCTRHFFLEIIFSLCLSQKLIEAFETGRTAFTHKYRTLFVHAALSVNTNAIN